MSAVLPNQGIPVGRNRPQAIREPEDPDGSLQAVHEQYGLQYDPTWQPITGPSDPRLAENQGAEATSSAADAAGPSSIYGQASQFTSTGSNIKRTRVPAPTGPRHKTFTSRYPPPEPAQDDVNPIANLLGSGRHQVRRVPVPTEFQLEQRDARHRQQEALKSPHIAGQQEVTNLPANAALLHSASQKIIQQDAAAQQAFVQG